MARIPDHEIERLKKEISVERLAEARGIQLTRHGADLVGKCPFHDDRTPSLVITPAKNLWHCLGMRSPATTTSGPGFTAATSAGL
jgi:DNA primase